jgi:hypothetical protein
MGRRGEALPFLLCSVFTVSAKSFLHGGVSRRDRGTHWPILPVRGGHHRSHSAGQREREQVEAMHAVFATLSQ